jgi:hypothetical protein
MNLLQALLISCALLATGVALAPSASADTCIVFDPTVEEVVCGGYYVATCVLGNAVPKPNVKGLLLCDAPLVP